MPGGRVWYEIAGRGGEGIPLLVLHGGPGAPHDYLESLGHLSDERPVIFYDQLGCGLSERPLDEALFTLERFVEELRLVREAVSPGEVHILGHSWGTMVALEYMLTRDPPGVRSLILSGPALSVSRFVADQRRYLLDLPEDMRQDILKGEESGDYDSPRYQAAMTEYYRRHVCRMDPWPESMERTLEKMGHAVYRYMWGPSEFTMTGTLKGYERAEDLGGIRVPVLFTAGEFDEATPSAMEYYHSRCPGSETALFEGASHMHHLEKAGPFLARVREYLCRVEGNRQKT